MKLATYYGPAGFAQVGIVHGTGRRVFDLAAAAKRAGVLSVPFASMQALIDAGDPALEQIEKLVQSRIGEEDLSLPLAEVELLAPVPEPKQMRDGMSFAQHIRQAQRGMRRLPAASSGMASAEVQTDTLPELADVYRQIPIYYFTNRLVVRGNGTTIKWPRYSKVMDFELEFGIFIRNTSANIRAADAKRHIFGFTIFNDFSARDMQQVEMQGWLGPAKGKSFDGANVLGPWIVTPDEIGDPYSLTMEARVNGETWTRSTSQGMLFSFEEMIAYMSRDETLHAGEFIGSGTVGNGCGLELGRFLKHGDVIDLDVERIGVLTNRVEQQLL